MNGEALRLYSRGIFTYFGETRRSILSFAAPPPQRRRANINFPGFFSNVWRIYHRFVNGVWFLI
jgi:hypothetical protein